MNAGTSNKHVLREDISVLVALGVHAGHRDCTEHCVLDMAAFAYTAARVPEKFASPCETYQFRIGPQLGARGSRRKNSPNNWGKYTCE